MSDNTTISGGNSPKADKLALPGGEYIAYRRQAGAAPGLIFLSGFRSDMSGTKALHVEDFARRRGLACLCFDYFGHGLSSGDFAKGTIGHWGNDAVTVLDALTEGPQILIGSSMGGWLMLLAALSRPERVAGLLGIAAAPDFTEELMWEQMPPERRQTLLERGFLEEPSDYSDEPLIVTRQLIEEGRNHLLLARPIPLSCPVRLIHGMEDPDVPFDRSLALADALVSSDVEITLIKGGDHRLSAPRNLALLERILDELVAAVG